MSSRTFIVRENSVPDLKVSKDYLALFEGLMQLVTLRKKPMLIEHSGNPRALKN